MKYKSLSRSVLTALSVLFAAVLLAACSDINVSAGMSDVSKANGEREAAAAIQEAEEAQAAAAIDTDDAEIALNEDAAAVADDPTPADGAADPETETETERPSADDPSPELDETDEPVEEDERADDEDLPGQTARVTEGNWTVAQNDLGVRVRSTPAGEILGFIVRGDIIATTGRGRVLNNVAWGEIQTADGTTGWMALDLLSAASETELAGDITGAVSDESAAEADTGDNEASETDTSTDASGTDASGTDEAVSTEASITDGLARLTVQPQSGFVSNRSVTLAIWSEPRFGSTNLGTMDEGDDLVIVSPDGWRNGEVPFVRVAWDGVEGWVDGRFLDVAE